MSTKSRTPRTNQTPSKSAIDSPNGKRYNKSDSLTEVLTIQKFAAGDDVVTFDGHHGTVVATWAMCFGFRQEARIRFTATGTTGIRRSEDLSAACKYANCSNIAEYGDICGPCVDEISAEHDDYDAYRADAIGLMYSL